VLLRRPSDLASFFPVTFRGVLFLALSSFLAFAGWGFEWFDFEVRPNPYFWGWAVTALSVFLFFFLIILIGLLVIRVKSKAFLETKQPSVEANGNWEPTGFRLPWLFSLLPVWVSVRWISPFLNGSVGGARLNELREEVKFRRRGRFEKVERQLVLEDWLGLFRFNFFGKSNHPFCVSSCDVRVENTLPLVQSAGEVDSPKGRLEGEYLDMRPYRPGDPIKYMFWKLWAKTNGEMKYVRTPDPVGDEQFAMFLFSHPNDEANARVLRNVSAGKRNLLFGVGTMNGSFEEGFATEENSEVEDFLLRSGSWPIDEEKSGCYRSFLETVRRKHIGTCWVFFPPGGEKEERLVSLLREETREGLSYFVAYGNSDEVAAKKTIDVLKNQSPGSEVVGYSI
jgi:hypothetical protein